MIRPAQFAGSFYPADKTELKEQVSALLESAPEIVGQKKRPLILLVPHAGYLYSGPVAAAGFKSIKNWPIKRVILLGIAHQSWFEGAVIDQHEAWETPLGPILLDQPWAEKIVDPAKKIFFSSTPHLPEHSLEVELPFLQLILTNFKIVPILLGITDRKILTALAEKLAQNLDNQTLLVISSDLSHYPNYEIAQQVDQKTINAILTGDPDQLEQTIRRQMAVGYPNLETCACGETAIKVGLQVGQRLGSGQWRLINYANSGDTGGEKSQVVGYAAIGYFPN